jgi:hypothetical protein
MADNNKISRRGFLRITGAAIGAHVLAPADLLASDSKAPLSDNELLDLVQKQTLKYFWDFGHPASGMARERSNGVEQYGKDIVTTGGTGFGIMAMIAGTSRGWLTRKQTVERLTKIVGFLEKADSFHGVYPHYLDGDSGKVYAASTKDDGADLVETSLLMMGLLTARQYFSADTPDEKALRAKINAIWEKVDWKWHTPGEGKDLYWHWSPKHDWAMNLPIKGWNECLVTHVLAASSPTHAVSPDIYQNSWPSGNDFRNGQKPHGIEQPLGPKGGGPLFLSQYSFMGINPKGLKDKHADYWVQNKNHVLINRAHCIQNPKGYAGYGSKCWGLTSSDDHVGYGEHSPTNDVGVIAPTAALSSFPYTPEYSMEALRHFYQDLGDAIWKEHGFVDAFKPDRTWVAKTHLAIDQGPIVGMIENYRSGLLWSLFMSCPEVRHGMKKMGFESPHLVAEAPRPRAGERRHAEKEEDWQQKIIQKAPGAGCDVPRRQL